MKKNQKKPNNFVMTFLPILVVLLVGGYGMSNMENTGDNTDSSHTESRTVHLLGDENSEKPETTEGLRITADTLLSEEIPDYKGDPVIIISDNIPAFAESELTTDSYEKYTSLDKFGRCGEAVACVGKDLMPTEKRGSIGMIKPSGWHTVRYDDLIEGKYLYNRCHLIAFQLAGENANEQNLITGTRYLNVSGMLPFEEEVADYIKATGNHVLYRVTPVFVEKDLVARGVQMEAFSVEDNGKGVSFNVFCYNVQPGIKINYRTGESSRIE